MARPLLNPMPSVWACCVINGQDAYADKRVPYYGNQVSNSARWQIFLRDPNNVEIELNFESKSESGG